MDNKEIISRYLKEKSNEDEVIAFLQEQKKVLANSRKDSILLNEEYFSLMLTLCRNSKGKIKYHAIIILSNIEFCMKADNFNELCQIAFQGSNDKDGHIRRATFILIKNLNAVMMILPLINKSQNVSKEDVNLFYESFRSLFHELYFLFYDANDTDIKKSILKPLEIMLPQFQDMVKFWNDDEEIGMITKIKNESGMDYKWK